MGARLTVDGVSYRESGSLFRTATRLYKSGVLTGMLSLPLRKGSHRLALQWKKWGTSVPSWTSAPSIFGGFVSGRGLVAYGLPRHTGVVSLQNLAFDQIKPPANTEWSEISGSRANVELETPGVVRFSFRLGTSQVSPTTRDFWTWNRWNALAIRLVVNGRVYRTSGTSIDSTTKVTDGAYGELVLNLPQGSHSAVLEWKHEGSDEVSWQTVQRLLDGFGGSTSFLSVARSWNEAPVIVVPAYLSAPVVLIENENVNLAGISILDADSEVVFVTLQVEFGSVSLLNTADLSFALGDGERDQFISFQGPLEAANKAISHLTYHPPLDWNGQDRISLTVDDQAEHTVGGSQSSSANLHLDVLTSNSPPMITLPAFQSAKEDEELLIYGITLYDADATGEVENADVQDSMTTEFQVSLLVLGGTLRFEKDRKSGVSCREWTW